jgi:cytochrome c-type biogenesis protein CcmH
MGTMLGAGDDNARFDRVGHKMMCACSCGQILVECNHVGCPDSNRMIGELRTQIADGGSDANILNWFATKYGATVLAAPIRGGFDDVAWILPITAFILATLGTAVLIRVWRARTGKQVLVGAQGRNAAADELRERIRRETLY